MKYLIKGIIRLMLIIILMPILLLLMFIEILYWIGGKEPLNTPITPIRDWIADCIFKF